MNTFYKLLSTLYICLLANNTYAQFPFADGFESGGLSSGMWNVSGNAMVSTTNPATGTYCLEGPSTWGINRTFTASGVAMMTVEFNAKSSQNNTVSMIFRIKDQPGGTACGLIFDANGDIACTDSSGPTSYISLMQYSTDKWYFIRFEMDYTFNTYDLYIDNQLVANDYVFYSAHFTDPWIFTWSSVATTGTAWLDDINIYHGTAADVAEQRGEVLPFSVKQSNSELSLNSISGFIDNATIYNYNGEVLHRAEYVKDSHSFDIGQLSAGIYFLSVNVNGKIYTERFVR